MVQLISLLNFLYLHFNSANVQGGALPSCTSYLMCSFFGIVSQWLCFAIYF